MSDPLSTKDEISTAQWGDKLPLTLRDDELLITEGTRGRRVFSHENDTPEEVDFTGTGLTMTGSFIRATRSQMAALMGGTAEAQSYEHPATKLQLEKAFKVICQDESLVIIPRAQGYVNMNLSLGKGGISKFPFKFRLKKASADWDCDIKL